MGAAVAGPFSPLYPSRVMLSPSVLVCAQHVLPRKLFAVQVELDAARPGEKVSVPVGTPWQYYWYICTIGYLWQRMVW